MIIAEIGQNFDNNPSLARYLINEAKRNGADLVKFQLFDYEKTYGENSTIPKVELSFDEAKVFFDFGKEIGIEVFFSVFDVERVKWCEQIGVKRYKIASLFHDEPTIEAIRNTGKDIIESTQYDRRFGTSKALYCPSGYPQTKIELDNLKWADGYSDHSVGIDIVKIVLARKPDAIIEKHFAHDHQTGVDAKWSMTPFELKELSEWSKKCQEL